MEAWLLLALLPAQPLYTTWTPKAMNVQQCDHELQQMWGFEVQCERFRVASILDAGKVRQNLIYFYTGRRHHLIASVDFCRHGDAPAGHWHLNRTPTGECVEHWGPGGDVYHGTCFSCPPWWLVIPGGLDYLQRPLRLYLLPEGDFGQATATS